MIKLRILIVRRSASFGFFAGRACLEECAGIIKRFQLTPEIESIIEGLMTMANEGVIALSPTFISHLAVPNVVMIPIAEKEATWDLFVVWQRGKTAGPLRALLDCLQSKP